MTKRMMDTYAEDMRQIRSWLESFPEDAVQYDTFDQAKRQHEWFVECYGDYLSEDLKESICLFTDLWNHVVGQIIAERKRAEMTWIVTCERNGFRYKILLNGTEDRLQDYMETELPEEKRYCGATVAEVEAARKLALPIYMC